MQLIKFINKQKQHVFVNPTQVVSVNSLGTDVVISLSNGGHVVVDYSGTSAEKAVWFVTETLKLGRHPYEPEPETTEEV